MYPRTAEALPVSQVVQDWTRSGHDRPEPDELLSDLLCAFWRDDLRLLRPGGKGTASRKTFLSGLHNLADTAGIIFVGSEAAVPPEAIHQPDGWVVVDLTHYVVLPSDPRELDRETLAHAYAALAEVPASAYPPELLTIFRCHLIQREDFGRLCDVRNWARPSFWFRSAASRGTTAERNRHRRDCEAWLQKTFAASLRLSKPNLKRQAKVKFPALRDADFNRLWEQLAPSSWRQAGALPKKSKGADSPI